jgi:tRNA pseudouridine55 synthase
MTAIDGLLIVDKPQGLTSMDVVREVKKRFGIRKAGHVGTLDPFATGVLPVALNEATKAVPFLKEEPKDYEATLKLGEETNTDDRTGMIVSRDRWEGIVPETVRRAFDSFLGSIDQIPPMFSAIKVRGTPLYRWARKGIEIDRKERQTTIFDLKIDSMDLPEVVFRTSCSKGTYIRALARDIGRQIGCGGHLRELRRTRSGSFGLDQSIGWETLKRVSGPDGLRPWVIPLSQTLTELPELTGDDRLVRKVRTGQEVLLGDLSSGDLPSFERGQWVRMSSSEEGLIAVLKSEMEAEELRGMSPHAVVFRALRVFHSQHRSD